MKARLKAVLMSQPGLWLRYQRVKLELRRLARLTYYWRDIVGTYRAMHWPAQSRESRVLSAALLFQYHKLEKGLVMPGPRRMFGSDPSRAVIGLLRRWHAAQLPVDDPIYRGALETLQAYLSHVVRHGLDKDGGVTRDVSSFLGQHPVRSPELQTPAPLPQPLPDERRVFESLARRRRSVRSFRPDAVPVEILRRAAATAALSPSACNRQPCRVHVVADDDRKKRLLAHQNGNRGFGHLLPQVLVITADAQGFFDASERHQPYIDGGLFAMSLCYALVAEGVATCCLNWCVPPADDRAAHAIVGLRPSERIIMLMAVGYASDDCMVPRSPRRGIGEVVLFDQSAVPVGTDVARSGAALLVD
jgi:nitroreductase